MQEDPSSIPGSGRSPGEGSGNPLQYSWLENLMERRAWQAIVHGVTKRETQLMTKTHAHINTTAVVKKKIHYHAYQ